MTAVEYTAQTVEHLEHLDGDTQLESVSAL